MSILKNVSVNVDTFPTMKVLPPSRNKFYKGIKLDEEWEVRGMTV